MNWFPFDMDAWNRRTKELGHTHRGIYVTLLAWYYGTGGPLPLEWPALFRIAEAQGDDERNATRRVLETFFDCRDTGWHNVRADEEVTRYVNNGGDVTRDKQSVTGVTLGANRDTSVRRLISGAKRQQTYRDRKTEVIGQLRRLGATSVTMATPMGELRMVGDKLGITIPSFGKNVTSRVTTDTRNHSNNSSLLLREGASEGAGGEGAASVESAEKSGSSAGGTLAGEVCRSMKQQGLWPVNPAHPKLVALLAAGATPDEFTHTAAEAVATGKPFAWVLAVVKGRREDQAKEFGKPQQGPKSGRGDFKTDRLRAWVPELAAAPQAPDFATFDDRMPHAAAE